MSSGPWKKHRVWKSERGLCIRAKCQEPVQVNKSGYKGVHCAKHREEHNLAMKLKNRVMLGHLAYPTAPKPPENVPHGTTDTEIR